MKPQTPPASVAAADRRDQDDRRRHLPVAARSRAIVAPRAPIISWPSPPMLNMPARNEIATARPAKIKGVAATSVSVIGRIAVAMSLALPVWSAVMIRPGSPKAPDEHRAVGVDDAADRAAERRRAGRVPIVWQVARSP